MQMHLGSETLALRYLVSLGVGYLTYLSLCACGRMLWCDPVGRTAAATFRI